MQLAQITLGVGVAQRGCERGLLVPDAEVSTSLDDMTWRDDQSGASDYPTPLGERYPLLIHHLHHHHTRSRPGKNLFWRSRLGCAPRPGEDETEDHGAAEQYGMHLAPFLNARHRKFYDLRLLFRKEQEACHDSALTSIHMPTRETMAAYPCDMREGPLQACLNYQ